MEPLMVSLSDQYIPCGQLTFQGIDNRCALLSIEFPYPEIINNQLIFYPNIKSVQSKIVHWLTVLLSVTTKTPISQNQWKRTLWIPRKRWNKCAAKSPLQRCISQFKSKCICWWCTVNRVIRCTQCALSDSSVHSPIGSSYTDFSSRTYHASELIIHGISCLNITKHRRWVNKYKETNVNSQATADRYPSLIMSRWHHGCLWNFILPFYQGRACNKLHGEIYVKTIWLHRYDKWIHGSNKIIGMPHMLGIHGLIPSYLSRN